jgi:hypothetical protein
VTPPTERLPGDVDDGRIGSIRQGTGCQ